MPLGRIRKAQGGRVAVEMTPWKMRFAALIVLAFFIGGVAGAVFASSMSTRVLLGLCALVFGGVFLIGLPNLFRRRSVAVITVTPDGIETGYAGLIPWHEIERVDYTSIVGQPALGIWTKDPFFSARRGRWWVWPFALFNRAFGFPPLSFTKAAVPIDELRAQIEQHWTSTSTRADVELVPLDR